MLWNKISSYFEDSPAKAKVARIMINYGFRIEGKDIYCGKIKISKSQIAKVAGVNIKSIDATIETITGNPRLKDIFYRLQPMCNLKSVASVIGGWDVIEIFADNPHRPGLLAPIAKLIADEGISIIEAIMNTQEEDKKTSIYIITENSLTEKTIRKIIRIEGIKEVHHIYL